MSEGSRYRAIVDVLLKRSIHDPQGRAVEATLRRLGHTNVSHVRVGKRIELVMEGSREEVERQLEAISRSVLSNPVMEEIEFTLEAAPEDTAPEDPAREDPALEDTAPEDRAQEDPKPA